MSYETYLEALRPRMGERRRKHSIAVCREAVRLARKYGADPEKAETAGILHDICKETPDAEQLRILSDFGIMLTSVEKKEPKLYHAMSGSVYIQQQLVVSDPDIVNAVRYHTTARAGMSLLEKVLYLADYTSADRDYPGVTEMRELVEIGILPAMEFALRFTVSDLCERGRCIHPDTISAYNEVMLSK